MSQKGSQFELIHFEIGASICCGRSPLPTACLLVVEHPEENAVYSDIVNQLLQVGCRFVLTWGAEADMVHDLIDSILEAHGGAFQDIVTTSHRDEEAHEIAWFLVNAAFPGESKVRCLVGHQRDDAAAQKVLTILGSQHA